MFKLNIIYITLYIYNCIYIHKKAYSVGASDSAASLPPGQGAAQNDCQKQISLISMWAQAAWTDADWIVTENFLLPEKVSSKPTCLLVPTEPLKQSLGATNPSQLLPKDLARTVRHRKLFWAPKTFFQTYVLAIGYIIRDGQIDVCSVLFKCVEVPGCGAAHWQETQNLESFRVLLLGHPVCQWMAVMAATIRTVPTSHRIGQCRASCWNWSGSAVVLAVLASNIQIRHCCWAVAWLALYFELCLRA